MKGSVVRFISTTVFIVFGVLIVWWFKSVVTSEVFIVSDRHRETFSSVNYVELGRKTFEEAVITYSQTGASKAGSAGGVIAEPPKRKDGLAIWKTSPSADTIKSALNEFVSNELKGSLTDTSLPGKFLAIKYENPAISVEADNPDFSRSEKILVKGSGSVKASKSLKTQAISIATGLKVNISTTVKAKYFALYDAGKRFFDGGFVNSINSAFGTINTVGTKMNNAPKCTSGVSVCDPSNLFSSACPSSSAAVPTDAEVLAATGYSILSGLPLSIPIQGEPFASFRAKFEKYGTILTKAGYNDPADKAVTTGSCSFTCTYQWMNPCRTTVTDCAPAAGSDAEPACASRCVPGIDINTQSCSAETKTSRISFTFLADMYAKYSSEDPNSIVPSQSLSNIAGKMLPYDTIKFNFLTHSCSMIKSGVTTDVKDDTEPCSFPATLRQM